MILQKQCHWKIWFSSYRQKCSWPINLQDFLICDISKIMWGISFIFFIYIDSYKAVVWSCEFCWVSQSFLGMSKVLWNKKLPIFLQSFSNIYGSRSNPGRREKIKLNFYFHTCWWCFKRFFEGLKDLHKTFWGTTKKCEDKNLT